MAAVPVEVRGLGRRFGARIALAGVELRVEPGEIVGPVGPNGSGKTTLLRILAGLLRASAGEARVFGLEPFGRRELVMQRARFAFAPPALFESLTAREHLAYLSRLGLRSEAFPTPSAIESALETVGLRERAGDRVHTFSFGMRQRLLLAQALLPLPELLVQRRAAVVVHRQRTDRAAHSAAERRPAHPVPSRDVVRRHPIGG